MCSTNPNHPEFKNESVKDLLLLNLPISGSQFDQSPNVFNTHVSISEWLKSIILTHQK